MAAWAEKAAAAANAGRSWRQAPLGPPHAAESPVRQSVQLPGPGGQLEDENNREIQWALPLEYANNEGPS